MNILSIDTSQTQCSIALSSDSGLSIDVEMEQKKHSQILLQRMDELLASHQLVLKDIHRIAFCHGPGSFTGLRIGASVSQVLSFTHDIDVFCYSSLFLMAHSAFEKNPHAKYICCVIDAKMESVYFARFEVVNGQLSYQVEDCLVSLDENFIEQAKTYKNDCWTGDGVDLIQQYFEITSTVYDVQSGTKWMLELTKDAHASDALRDEAVLPVYLRDSQAWKKLE